MAVAVVMNALSPTMTEGKIVQWRKKEGEPVKAGEVVAEVETDKAIMDLEAPEEGVLLRIFVGPGGVAPVGGPIGAIGSPGEDVGALAPKGGATAPAATPAPAAVAPPSPPGPTPLGPGGARLAARPKALQAPAPAPAGRIRASPLARRMARERGIELAGFAGSGPGGRVVRRDIEQAMARGGAPARPAEHRPPSAPPAFSPPPRPVEGIEPLSSMRRTIATRMVQAKRDVPHFYLSVDVDMERAVEMRAQLKELGTGATLTDVIVKAAGWALLRVPEVNAQLEGDKVHRLGAVDVGVAVAIEGGLITPVIRNVDQKSIAEIARDAKDLAERSRARRLRPEEYTAGSITVSNLGMYGIDTFIAIINPPQSAILAVGAVVERPVAVEGKVEVRRRMWVTLSGDHRVIDGAVGARYLSEFKGALERPLVLMM